MEPITVILIAALTSGLSEVGKSAAKDAYGAVKDKLADLMGRESEPLQALEKLEKAPDSAPLQQALNSQLSTNNLTEEPDLKGLIEALTQALAESQSGQASLAKFNIKANNIGMVVDKADNITMNFN